MRPGRLRIAALCGSLFLWGCLHVEPLPGLVRASADRHHHDVHQDRWVDEGGATPAVAEAPAVELPAAVQIPVRREWRHIVLHHSATETGGAERFELEALVWDRGVYIDVTWQGAPIQVSLLESWLGQPLSESLGGLRGRDILEHHRSEVWCDSPEPGRARLHLPLPPAVEDHLHDHEAATALPPRPEFYDFDLLKRMTVGELDSRPVIDLESVTDPYRVGIGLALARNGKFESVDAGLNQCVDRQVGRGER